MPYSVSIDEYDDSVIINENDDGSIETLAAAKAVAVEMIQEYLAEKASEMVEYVEALSEEALHEAYLRHQAYHQQNAERAERVRLGLEDPPVYHDTSLVSPALDIDPTGQEHGFGRYS